MSKSPLIFRTSGIRGAANSVISPELAIRIGRSFAAWIKTTYTADSYYIYVGYDNRRNSRSLANCISAALNSAGINVIQFTKDVPTPLVIHATVNNQSHGGVMITGSHLPPQDNGIILFDHLGNYYKGELEDVHEESDWEHLGKRFDAKTEIDEYRLFIVQQAEKLGIVKNDMKVLIDTVHGPMYPYVELAVRQFTDNIETYNIEYDDTFPGRASEPNVNSLQKTREKLLETGSDLAICTDMDGDRVLFIEGSGKIITGDYLGAILSNIFWKSDPELPVVAPINTSGILEIAADKIDGKINFCNVGPPSIIQAIRESKAKFGFEETGKYMFSEIGIWPDSAISSLYLMSLLQKSNRSLNEFVNELPVLHSKKEKLPSPRKLSDDIMDNLTKVTEEKPETIKLFIEKLNKEFSWNIDIDFYSSISNILLLGIDGMDGLRFNLSDHSYFMIRPSGTENYIRIFCESPDLSNLELLSTLGNDIVNRLQKYMIN